MIFCRVTMLVIIFMNLGLHLGNHGSPRNGTYDFGGAVISAVINLLLLWGGGFFG